MKENLNKIFKRCLTKEAMNLVFVKPEFTEQPIQPFKRLEPLTPEEQLVRVKKCFSIRVQSVALPKEHQLFTLKTEGQFMNWMQNKISNVHTAFHRIESKFDMDDVVHWSNNKIMNQRYLEIKKLYECNR